MIEPAMSDDQFLTDVEASLAWSRHFDLWWLGQSGYLIHHREGCVLIDPYLSDSLTTKYLGTEKPHDRISRRVVDPAALAALLKGRYTVVTSSHAHTDHLDPGTLRPLFRDGVIRSMIAPAATAQLVVEQSAATSLDWPLLFHGLDDGLAYKPHQQLKVTAVAAAHDEIDRDADGRCKYLGYVFEFSRFERSSTGSIFQRDVEWRVYHSGDTIVYSGLADRVRAIGPIDVAILPINGKVGNMGGRDAARLAKDIGARLVIPCHYDLFAFNTADPNDEFVPECKRIGQPYRVLKLGERFRSAELPPRG